MSKRMTVDDAHGIVDRLADGEAFEPATALQAIALELRYQRDSNVSLAFDMMRAFQLWSRRAGDEASPRVVESRGGNKP